MLKLSDSRNFSRTFAGLSLILAPLLYLAAGVLMPWSDTDTQTGQLDAVAASPVQHQTAAVLLLIGSFFWVAGLAGAMHLLRSRRLGLGQVGATLVAVAAISINAFYVDRIIEATGTRPGYDREQLAALLDATASTGWLIGLLIVGFGGFFLGLVLFALGLWRRRAVPIWSPLAILAGALATLFQNGPLLAGITGALLAVGVGEVGVRILRLSDDQWAQWQVLPDLTPKVQQPAPPHPTAPTPT